MNKVFTIETIIKLLMIVICWAVNLHCNGQINGVELSPMVLGNRLENPYSVENMSLAYEHLVARGDDVPEIQIEVTHKYIKFYPRDSSDYIHLWEDESLEIFDHPLDYEIVSFGDYYIDPSLEPGQVTFQYTVIPEGYHFSEEIDAIPHEALAELYLTDSDDGLDQSGRTAATDNDLEQFNMNLEDEALLISGNGNEIIDSPNARRNKYRPSGKIYIESTVGTINLSGKSYEGVPRVKARVRRWFTVKTAFTNANGEFEVNHRFRRDVNFGIIYRNGFASINPSPISGTYLMYGGAFMNGPKGKSWTHYSSEGNESHLWGTLMQAVYDYHHTYAPMYKIGAPSTNLKIAAHLPQDLTFGIFDNDRAFALMAYQQQLLGIDVDIRIGLSDIYIKKLGYKDLYLTAIHELSHAAHWEKCRNWSSVVINKSNRMVTEAWADGVEEAAALYKFSHSSYFQPQIDLEQRIELKYPQVIVRDLKDDTNDDSIIDNVSGVTLENMFLSLENPLIHNSLEAWRDNLIRYYPLKKESIREYFSQWLEEDYIPCADAPLILSQDLTGQVTYTVEHTNSIVFKPGFRFRALSSNYSFEAKVFCSVNSRVAFNKMEKLTHIDDVKLSDNISVIKLVDDGLIKESVDHQVSMFPNPVLDIVNINGEGVYDVTIWTMRGEKIYHKSDFKNKGCIDLRFLDSGLYIIRLVNNNITRSTKFIKK